MRLLFPVSLAWLAIALPIVALYILKVRRRRHVVPTLIFWEQVFGQAAPRSLWRTLRHWLSLLLQLAMVLLLALALADPVAGGTSRLPRHYLIVLDQSASMQATDGSTTRFEQARRFAHQLVRSMRSQDRATVLAAGLQTVIVSGRTHHQPTLHHAIDSLAPTDAPCDLAEALRHAAAIDPDNPQRSLALITDGPGLAQLRADLGQGVNVYRCGASAGNVAITGFAVRPRADNPVELQGMLRLANFTDNEVATQVRLTLDDNLSDILLVKLAPDEEKVQPFRHMHTAGHVLRAELVDSDALQLDNTAVAILPAIDRKQVLLVSSGNLFLRSVLASHPWMEVREVAPDAFDPAAAGADIWVFDKYVPAQLPAGPCLFVDPQKSSELWTIGDEIRNPLVSQADEASPLLRHVHLTNCTIHRARAIQSKQPARHLVQSFENPLLLEWTAGPAVRVALAIDINQSDLPWRTAFPILVQNVLNELAGRSDEPAGSYHVGQTCSLAIDGSDLSATDEKGRPVPLIRQDAKVLIGPVTTAGLVTLKAAQQQALAAFNLADSRESNIRHGADLPGAQSLDTGVLASIGSWPWWVILVVLAAALSATEWALHQRRRID